MPDATYRFPKGFLWGTATSSHQVEGQNVLNDWYAWENEPGRIQQGHQAGLACDWWGGRWQEDLSLAAEGGQNAHRLSIEWSRIEPKPDQWDDDALDYYRQMLAGMRKMGLTPVVTLHHFTIPLWLYELGGWENGNAPVYFETYVRKVVHTIKDLVSIWVTLNEPNGLVVNAYIDGGFPPGKKDFSAGFHALCNLIRAHARAYHAIHEIQRDALVAYALYFRGFFPSREWFYPDTAITRTLSRNLNELFSSAIRNGKVRFVLFQTLIKEAIGTQDYIALQYYSSDLVSFSFSKPKELFSRREYPKDVAMSETGFIANVPEGMYQALKWARQFNLPIYITENGVEDSTDNLRPAYLALHLHQVWRATNFNWQVKGYFHWTQVDNFEWERGWTQRFGLWGLDLDTRQRIHRPSADMYAAICKENGLSSQTVRQFAPFVVDTLFPV